MIGNSFGFVIVILRSDTANGQRERKTCVLLGCERGGKYRQYKKDLDVTKSEIRKCDCPFKLRGKPVNDGESCILKLLYGSTGRLTNDENSMFVDMTKTSAKPRNILLTLKKSNEKNVTTIKQIYNVMNTYRRTERGHRTEMQHHI